MSTYLIPKYVITATTILCCFASDFSGSIIIIINWAVTQDDIRQTANFNQTKRQ